MLFDTHAHLDDKRFDQDRHDVIAHIFASGVSHVVNVGSNMNSSQASVDLASRYDGIYASVGVHPHEAESMSEQKILQLKQMAAQPKVVAIGEIGLDYYYDNSPRDVQRHWFARQLELAVELNLPVIIHDRDAHGDTMDMLRATTARGIVHCYSGSAEMAEQLVQMGFYIAFGGVLTYPNAKQVVRAAEAVPVDRLLLETDCPYLAPDGHRGKRNDSSLIGIVCEKMAQLKGLSFEQMARITTENAKKVYRIDH